MAFRVGGWLLAIGFTTLALLGALNLAGALHPLQAGGVVVLAVVALGLGLWATTSTGWIRALFGFATLGCLARLVDQLASVPEPVVLLALSGHATVAGGAMLRGASKRLGWTMIPLTVLAAIVVVVGRSVHMLPLDLLAGCLALDLLGGFPTIARIPQAAIRNVAVGRLVTAIGFAWIAMGGWLGWLTLERIARRSSPATTKLMFAGICMLAGILVLWRRRRMVSVPIVVALVLCIAGGIGPLQTLVMQPFERTVLVIHELPVVRLALPSGEATTRAYRDAGQVEVAADHVALRDVGVAWGFLDEPELTDADVTRVAGVAVEITIAIWDGPTPLALLAWSCGELNVRATFGATGTTRLQHRELAERMARTVECVTPPPWVPRVVVPVALPAPFQEEPTRPGFRTFHTPDGRSFSLSWTKDLDLRAGLDDGIEAFRWFVDAELLASEPPVQRSTLLVDGEYRWLAAIEQGERRLLLGVYYCRELGSYVSAGYDGPRSEPPERGISLIRTAGCP